MFKDDNSCAAKAFRDLGIAEKFTDLMIYMKMFRAYIRTKRDEENISALLMNVCFDTMVSVLATTKDPAEYEKVCEDMGKCLYKAVVREKELLDD